MTPAMDVTRGRRAGAYGNRPLTRSEEFPSVAEIVACWEAVSPRIGDRLHRMTGEDLDRGSDQSFPLSGPAVRSGIHFLLDHEMYHIGQLGLLRKHAGLPAMRWS